MRVPGKFVTDYNDITKMEIQKRNTTSYQLIKTSTFIESTKAEFRTGYVFKNRHFVNVNIPPYNTNCKISNSFDGSMAFTISLNDGTINFGHIRQIHRGEHANNIETVSNEAIKILAQAPRILENLKNAALPSSTREFLFNLVLDLRGISKKAKVLTNYNELPINGYDFIVQLSNLVRNGNIEYSNRFKTKTARPITNEVKLLDIQTKIWKEFRKLHIEFYI